MTPEFLRADAALFLHDTALREHGGLPGLRDEGLLHSALGRPVNKLAYGGEGLDLFDLAASLAYGPAANHALDDADKRTAWVCCVLFLEVNGARLADPVERMVRLASGGLDEAGFAACGLGEARGADGTATDGTGAA